MPTSANCPKKPSDVRADVGIRAPILPLSQQPLASPAGRKTKAQRFTAVQMADLIAFPLLPA